MNNEIEKEKVPVNDNYSAKSHYQGDIAKLYLQNRENSLKWRKEQKIMDKLINALPSDSVVLDLPVGTGRLLPFYFNNNISVYGMDISKDMIEESRELHKNMNNIKEFIEGNAEDIPLPDNSVDHVICLRLLNLVPMSVLRNIIGEFARVSRSGVILQVRVKSKLEIGSLLLKLLMDPRTNFNRIMHSIFLWIKSNFIKLLTQKTEVDSKLSTENFFIHNSDEILNILSENGLKIVKSFEVDKGLDFGERIYKPLVIFDCNK